MSDYITLTFVVRTPTGEQPGDDPRTLLTDDEVMFWGREDGITEKALDLGADPSSWDEDEAPKVPDALYAEAEAAYDREDQEWFNSLSTEHLVAMWALCITINAPSWDDEVYDALAARGHWDQTTENTNAPKEGA